MLTTIINVELEKILRKKLASGMFLSVLFFEAAAAFVRYHLNTQGPSAPTGFQLSAFSIKTALQLFSLVCLIISAISVSEETGSGTIKHLLVRNVRRSHLILAKFISLSIIGITMVLLVNSLGLILGEIFRGLSDLKEAEYLVYSARKLFLNFGAGMMLTLPPVIALTAFGIFISTIVRESGWAVGCSIITLFLFQLLSQFDEIQHLVFTHYFFLPIHNIVKLTEGIPINWKADSAMIIAGSLIYAAIFVGLSMVSLNRKDL